MFNRNILKYLLLLSPLLSSLARAQPVIRGEMLIKGDSRGNSIIQTTDSGFAIAGYTLSYGDTTDGDVYVVRISSSGALEWTKTIGGDSTDIGSSIVQTKDGGVAIAGRTGSYGPGGSGRVNLYVIKLDAAGNLEWTKAIGGGGEYGNSIIQTKDGGLAITGVSFAYGAGDGDVYVVKLDSAGNLKWTKTIGGIRHDIGNSIIQTEDDGFAIAGTTNSFGIDSLVGGAYVIRLDSLGNLKWAKSIGGDQDERGNAIIQDMDGGFIITGFTKSFGDSIYGDVYIFKLDAAGNLKWTRTVGSKIALDEGYAITKTYDKNYIISGVTYAYDSNFGSQGGVYLIKFDSVGNIKWTKVLDTLNPWQMGNSIIQTKNGGYALTGSTRLYGGGLCVVLLDSSGNDCNPAGYGGSVSSGGNITSGGSVSSGGSVVNNGGIVGNGGAPFYSCGFPTAANTIKHSTKNIIAYPNPSQGVLTIQTPTVNNKSLIVDIYNMLGKKIYSNLFSNFNSKLLINVTIQPTGIYLFRILIKNTGDLIAQGKFIINRQ